MEEGRGRGGARKNSEKKEKKAWGRRGGGGGGGRSGEGRGREKSWRGREEDSKIKKKMAWPTLLVLINLDAIPRETNKPKGKKKRRKKIGCVQF